MQVQRLTVDHPCVDEHGVIVGSGFCADEKLGPVQVAAVLSKTQIMQKHGLTSAEFDKIRKQVQSTKVLDALFHWPDGVRYDVLMYLVATAR